MIPPSLRVKLHSVFLFSYKYLRQNRLRWRSKQRVVGCCSKLPQQRIECHCHEMHLERCSQQYAMPMHQIKQSCYFPEGEKKKANLLMHKGLKLLLKNPRNTMLKQKVLLKLSGQKSYKVVIQLSPKINVRVQDTLLSEYAFSYIRKAFRGENG